MSKNFTIKSAYLFYILYFLAIPFGFLTRILYSHSLTSTQFGMIYALYSFFGFFMMLSNLGFSSSLAYFIPKFNIKNQKDRIRDIFYYSLFIQQIIMWIFVLILFSLSKWLTINYFHNLDILIYFKIFILYFIFSNLMTLFRDLLISFKLNVYYQIIYFFNLFLIFLFSFLIYYFGFSNKLFYFLLSISLIYFLSFLMYFYLTFKKFRFIFSKPKFDKKLFLEFFSYSMNIFTSIIGFSILLQSDVFVITYFLSIKLVGIYTNSVILIDTLVTTLSIISFILMPYFTELKEKKNYTLLNSYLNLIYNLFIYIVVPFSLIMFLFPKQILSLIFGSKYIGGYLVLMIFSLFSIFKILLSYNLTFLSSFGLAKKLLFIIYPVALFNLILDLILVKPFGIEGIAFATGIGWVLISILTLRIIIKEIKGFKINFSKYFKIIILNILFVFLVIISKKIQFFSDYYINSGFILTIAFIIYFYLGNLFNIYKIEELFIFIPNEKFKNRIKNYHKRYFRFLK